MTAPELTEAEAVIVARFEAADMPEEVALIARLLDLADEYDEYGRQNEAHAEGLDGPDGAYRTGRADSYYSAADRIRAALATQAGDGAR